MANTATANPSFVPQSPSHWVPDEKRSACGTCHKDFTFFFRKHHCRSCREVFCGDCSDYRLLARDPKDPTVVNSVRACRACFDKFRGRKIRNPKAKAAAASGKVRRNSKAGQEKHAAEQASHHPAKLEVEMPEQHLHHEYEGEDPTITGTETVREEEDEDPTVYPEAAHQQRDMTLVMGDVPPVDRDVVMAAQASVVLPSRSANGGMQSVNVEQSTARVPPPAGASSLSAAGLPSDTQAIFKESHLTARSPMGDSHPAGDKLSVAVGGGEKDEFDRSGAGAGGAAEGSEAEIMNIPSDALATVKNSQHVAQQQQQQQKEGGEVAWSERNVESHFAAQSPTNGVPTLFKQNGEQ